MTTLIGCDFSSAPSRRKPIVIATGSCRHGRVQLSKLEHIETLSAYDSWVRRPGSWVGAFDFPFGLPRELVEHLGWPTSWAALMAHYSAMTRAEIRTTFSAFCGARPAGGKFAHRRTDVPAGASTSMKWVNPPVAFMLHAGVPPLIAAGAHFPGLHEGDRLRIALEGYPGLLAREVLGNRSYKSDDRSKQTAERLIARKDLVTALEMGRTRLALRLKLSHAQRDALVDDGKGDRLDAVLCLMQAAWALVRHEEGVADYGLPQGLDALEGWIITA